MSREHNPINILPSAEFFFQKYNPTMSNKTISRNKYLFQELFFDEKDMC